MKKLYIASALGFSELGCVGYKLLLKKISSFGYGIIDPWTLTDHKLIREVQKMHYGQKKKEEWAALNLVIGKNNAEGIKASDGIVAVLDGPDVDSGTASEVGYGAGLGKVVVGYRGDFRLSSDNEGSIVNLQVEYFINWSGGAIVKSLEELEKRLPKLIPVNGL